MRRDTSLLCDILGSQSMPPANVFGGQRMRGSPHEQWKLFSHDSPVFANPTKVVSTGKTDWMCRLCNLTIRHKLNPKVLAYARYMAIVLHWEQLPAAHWSCVQKIVSVGNSKANSSTSKGVFLLGFIPSDAMHELIFQKISMLNIPGFTRKLYDLIRFSRMEPKNWWRTTPTMHIAPWAVPFDLLVAEVDNMMSVQPSAGQFGGGHLHRSHGLNSVQQCCSSELSCAILANSPSMQEENRLACMQTVVPVQTTKASKRVRRADEAANFVYATRMRSSLKVQDPCHEISSSQGTAAEIEVCTGQMGNDVMGMIVQSSGYMAVRK